MLYPRVGRESRSRAVARFGEGPYETFRLVIDRRITLRDVRV
jgi:hypothetical protein